MNVVIVESAAKAKAINKYLGSNYKVLASFGHVRDLPSKDGSVEPDKDFEMHWAVDDRSSKLMREITKAVKGADKLILATDPDREGEAISWHILQILEQKKALKGVEVERVAFNAVTKQAVLDAVSAPREIDSPLVSAYLARRALDYLVGFTLSPVLWRKLPGSRSAGRVQSVALRLVCDREQEIEAFKPREYWTIEAELVGAPGKIPARLHAIDGKKLGKFDLANERDASAAKSAIEGRGLSVANVESKAVKRHPAPPFTTSTLQQEASRKLRFSASRTMQVAQKLYEGVDLGGETVGLITYMRTDGVQIVPEAISQARGVIASMFGQNYVPDKPRHYATKAKNAQEAHEAVRPTSFSRTPEDVVKFLGKDEAGLYKLIWQRAMASQMASAEQLRTTADFACPGKDGRNYGLRATGLIVTFDGFMKLYEEGRDDENGRGDDRRLPPLKKGDAFDAKRVDANQHFTEPPPRFTEATLVKRMEELGIGRPSTYASTLGVLRERDYVRLEKNRLVPEDKGRLVTAFLTSFFNRYVQYDFTAGLEQQLDLISDGKLEWREVLRDFWRDFTAAVNEIKDLRISEVLDALNEILGPHIFPDPGDGSDPRKCPSCEDGRLAMKTGRYGAFIGCSNYPDCKYTRQFSEVGEGDGDALTSEGRVLGPDPETGLEISVRSGRFGPYVQLGEAEEGEKPKRVSVPKGFDAPTLSLEQAIALLSLPKEVGLHPETGKPITAGIGRYGPFVEHQKTYANLTDPGEVFTVGLNRAVSLLAEKAKGGRGGASQVVKELGEHPEGGGVDVRSGRYGPYVKHGRINATLPKDLAPEDVTMDQAVKLIAERAAKTGKGTKAKKKTSPAGGAKKTTKSAKSSGGAKKSAASKTKATTDPQEG